MRFLWEAGRDSELTRARQGKVISVKPAAEQELAFSSKNCLITPRKLPYKRNVDMKMISFWENVL